MDSRIQTIGKYTFLLRTQEVSQPLPDRPEQTAVRAVIFREDTEAGEDLALYDYTWSPLLKPVITLTGSECTGDRLVFGLHLDVHQAEGRIQGEFSEDQQILVEHASQDAQTVTCTVTDIVRKTRFAVSPRHLEHVPMRTYPPTEGRQGPYGHPVIRQLPPIPRHKHP